MGDSDVELCRMKSTVHSNVIIGTIAKEFLFLKRNSSGVCGQGSCVS
jgi:hypothetical protein